MTSCRRVLAAAVGMLGAVVVLVGCTDALDVVIRNESGGDLYVRASQDGKVEGSQSFPEAGGTSSITWGSDCETQWLIVEVPQGGDYRMVHKVELQLCANDEVVIGPDFSLEVVCGERSREERADAC